MTDVRATLRSLRQSPTFTVTVVLTLACGIGASTLIFGIVDAVLLSPLPYPEPERLTLVWASNPERGWQATYASPADFHDLREDEALASAAAYVVRAYNLVEDGHPERLEGLRTSAEIFDVLGVAPALGRGFRPADDAPGAEPVAVLSHDLWRARFGGDPGVIGRSLDLSGVRHQVVGVMPDGFAYPEEVEVWVPFAMTEPERQDRGNHYLTILARLRPGVSASQADERLDAAAARLAERHPDTNRGWSVELTPLREQIVGEARPALLLLLGSVVLLLLVPCANVASLLLARSTARRRELALRSALGASRGRLAVHTLTESVILALLGGAVGVALAAVGVEVLRRVRPGGIPRLEEIAIDPRVLLFALGVSVATGLLFGQAPVLQLSGGKLLQPLRESGATGMAQPASRRLRDLLVVAQVALAAVLLVGAGLTIRSLGALLATDPGFEPEGVLELRLEPSPAAYPEPHRLAGYFERALAAAEGLPGASAAAYTTSLPLTDFFLALGFEIEGRPNPLPDERPSARFDSVSAGYFELMGVPLLTGRGIEAGDDRDAPGVVVINQTLAERFWGDDDPLGASIVLDEDGSGINPHRVVGVVGDVKQASLDAEVGPAIYTSFRQHPFPFGDVLVRAESGSVESLGPALRQAVWEVDRQQVVGAPRTLEAVVSRSLARPRFQRLVLGVFGAVSLLLATSGIYGMTAYTVARRRWELAVRMALGAHPGEAARRVARQGVALAAVGAGIGLAAATLLGRVAAGTLHGIRATDAVTFAAVLALLLAVALVASYLPARRVLKLDPMRVLRTD